MKRFNFFMVLVFAAGCLHVYAGNLSHIPFKTAKWTQEAVVEGKDFSQKMKNKVYFSGGKMRIEGAVEGAGPKKTEQITIIDGDTIYSYDAKSKQGVKMSAAAGKGSNPEAMNAEFEKCRKGAKKSGTEKISGVKCSIISYTCSIDGVKYKVKEWLSTADKFPMKTESKGGGVSTASVITSLKKNTKIDPAKFKPDKAVKFMEMGKGMPDMGKMMKDAGADDADEGEAEMMKNMMKNMFK
ncbi:MAG: LolA family protein [Candidatus Goldiibacteriota bacterium]